MLAAESYNPTERKIGDFYEQCGYARGGLGVWVMVGYPPPLLPSARAPGLYLPSNVLLVTIINNAESVFHAIPLLPSMFHGIPF